MRHSPSTDGGEAQGANGDTTLLYSKLRNKRCALWGSLLGGANEIPSDQGITFSRETLKGVLATPSQPQADTLLTGL